MGGSNRGKRIDRHGPFEEVRPCSLAGDYSLVLLRRLGKIGVENIVLSGEYYPRAKVFNAPEGNSIKAVLDFNDDGKMEIAVHWQYYEGDGVAVYSVDRGKAQVVLTESCGA